jgi:hypothetical protein
LNPSSFLLLLLLLLPGSCCCSSSPPLLPTDKLRLLITITIIPTTPTTTTNKNNNPKTEVKLRVSCGQEAPSSKLEADPMKKRLPQTHFCHLQGTHNKLSAKPFPQQGRIKQDQNHPKSYCIAQKNSTNSFSLSN